MLIIKRYMNKNNINFTSMYFQTICTAYLLSILQKNMSHKVNKNTITFYYYNENI